MPHHLLLVFLGLRFSGLASAIDAAFSVALSFSDRRLLVRDKPSVSVEEAGSFREFVSASRGADVGAGPLGSVAIDSCEDSDRVDSESRVGVDGTGDGKLMLDKCGLCTADGAAEGRAEGYGLAWRLYAPSVPKETGVENGRGCTWRRKDS
jgi:hypothetical protein